MLRVGDTYLVFLFLNLGRQCNSTFGNVMASRRLEIDGQASRTFCLSYLLTLLGIKCRICGKEKSSDEWH